MGRAARALTLVLLLTCPAQAGYIQNDAPAPPPLPACAGQETTDATEEPTTVGYFQNEAAGVLTQVSLDVLAVLPLLF